MPRRPEQQSDAVHTTPDKPRRRKALPVADEPWYEDGLRFRCTVCGNCCTGPPGYVWVTDAEVAKLAQSLKLEDTEFRQKYVRKVGHRLSLNEQRRANGNYDCVFLKPLPGDKLGKRRRGCSVYENRPLQCRTWPFWHGLLESREAWNHSKTTCPGLDAPGGKLYGVKEIEANRDAEAWPDDPPSSAK